ncbi:MAG: GHKL domain-containing protein [Candidatus Omnitrophica bacterium]|nr:GHKL domain-containing protein [Candidatus Omnitrophota bacterium]
MEKWFADGLPATGKKCFELCHHSSKPCNLCPIQRTLSTGKADREVLPRRGTGGKIAGWLEQFSFPLVDRSTGEVVGAIEYVRDITERKKSEDALRKAYADLKSMQDQLLQSEKMATVGQLAAGVAHEVNNPTAFVTSNLEVLGKYVSDLKVLLEKCDNVEYHLRASGTEGAGQLADDIQMIKEGQELDFILSDLPNLINESLDGMHRIQRIVADLRTFSHSDEGHWEEADLHELIQSALNIAWNEIKYKADVVKDYAELPRIQCYPQQLSQVFLNLLVNAIQSIEAKGTITLRTRLEGEMVLVEIADTGCGMTEEVRRRVFEPFFTTKPVGKGTGLGLSLAYNIIEKHGGTISVTSRLGEGSTFSVRLPRG